MTTAVLLVTLLGFFLRNQGSAELLEENCGNAYHDVATRIVGGQDAAINSNPWMAVLSEPGKDGKPPEFFCGGTLINECFVLTAAHCLNGKKKIIVRLGEHDRSSEDRTLKEDIYVRQAYIYPTYSEVDNANDIALLRLSRCVTYKHHIRPICILLNPRKKSLTDATQEFTAVGWGRTQTQVSSNVLQTATLNRLPMSRCDELFWNKDNKTDSAAQFCAGTSNGTDACEGDSGGPLYAPFKYAGVNRKTQLGIVSYGSSSCSGLGVYTDVMSYVDWIRNIVLASDIVVVVPQIDFLDSNCFSNSTPLGRARSQTSSFPWLAHVYIDSLPLAFGALISASFVISTAQLYPEGAPLQVRLGRDSGATEVTHKVESVLRHPDFVRLSVSDIALLKLETKVQFTDHIRPICLPSLTNKLELDMFRKKADTAGNLVAIGFGHRSSTPVRRLNATNCYQGNYQEIGEKQICMEHPHSTSLGSGSPLVRPLALGNGMAYTLVGLASFGRSDDRAPDVYTNVLSYSEWIAGLITVVDL